MKYKTIYTHEDGQRLEAKENCKHCYGTGRLAIDFIRRRPIICKCVRKAGIVAPIAVEKKVDIVVVNG